jgi:phosphate transport system permease protein
VAIDVNALDAGGPRTSARPLSVSRRRTEQRILLDRWMGRLVMIGGVFIIACILAILFVILSEVAPLFGKPTVQFVGRYSPGVAGERAAGRSVGVDEYRVLAFEVTRAGAIEFAALAKGGANPPSVPISGLDGARAVSVAEAGKGRYVVGTDDGRVIPFDMKFDVGFRDGTRSVTPAPVIDLPSSIDPEARRPVRRLAAAAPDSGPVRVAQLGPDLLVVQRIVEKKALIGGAHREESLETLRVRGPVEITALALDGRGEDLFAGTSAGQVIHFDLRNAGSAQEVETATVTRGGAPVSALGFLIGDRTLVVGDRSGGVASWQVVAAESGGERRLTRIHEFERHPAPVVSIAASPRDKGFATADDSGTVRVSYGTSGQTLLSLSSGEAGLDTVVFAPKGDALAVASSRGTLAEWQLHNPHPEVTLRTLFGKVWYEGYARPEYVWQSTGGTDDVEPKLSLTPLIFGTFKGTVYALLFAVPLALLAAIYVSEFMHPAVKAYVKPVVEIMAALPSVVLGFLAGLWLAPMVERIVPGLFMLPLVLPLLILLAYAGWRLLPRRIRLGFKSGTEIVLLVPVVVGGAWIAFALGGLIEATLLGGSYRGWLLSALGITYDQRNSLVVGVAMGFAVIPIIFTIAEDSLANVPQHLRAGSLALGATRWQTALRIVLPTASPGIFSAIMIGFGRAVGETMIVLMATGNTPIMDWSIFNGFRALSANVAVELPEAPEGGTLFRVLFLAAFLLFCLTFAVNTVAELVRLKLRAKYRYL